MPSLFNTEQEAYEYRKVHRLFAMVPEYIEGTGKWGLNFPLKCHVTVVPHTVAAQRSCLIQAAERKEIGESNDQKSH
jgi:hypothetical protein